MWQNCIFHQTPQFSRMHDWKSFLKGVEIYHILQHQWSKKNLGTYLKSCHLVKYDTKVVLLCSYISNFTFWWFWCVNILNVKLFDWFSQWIRQFWAKKFLHFKMQNFFTFYSNGPNVLLTAIKCIWYWKTLKHFKYVHFNYVCIQNSMNSLKEAS